MAPAQPKTPVIAANGGGESLTLSGWLWHPRSRGRGCPCSRRAHEIDATGRHQTSRQRPAGGKSPVQTARNGQDDTGRHDRILTGGQEVGSSNLPSPTVKVQVRHFSTESENGRGKNVVNLRHLTFPRSSHRGHEAVPPGSSPPHATSSSGMGLIRRPAGAVQKGYDEVDAPSSRVECPRIAHIASG
jgi:hypothetical protein